MTANIKEMIAETVAENGSRIAVRHKESGHWETFNYSELGRRVALVAEIMEELNLKRGDRVAIDMDNCSIWPELYFGIAASGCTAVPVDPKLGEQESAYILRHSECRAVFVSDATYSLVCDVIENLPQMRFIICAGNSVKSEREVGRVRHLRYAEIADKVAQRSQSENSRFKKSSPAEDDVASVIYTSGTTGVQKGAMLTHKNFCSNVESCIKAIDLNRDDHFLLVLPLHHVFAFTTNLLLPVRVGAEISMVENLRTVGDNMREVSPTALIAVPLLLEKVYNKIWRGLKKKRIVYALFKAGLKKPVIKGIREKMGGKLRVAISGGAPAGANLIHGFMDLGIPVLEGYGLTETAPVLTINPQTAPRPGSVGKPLPDVEIDIVDKNEQGVGEIAARGPNIMKGYLNNPEATSEIMRDDWLLTGDLGYIDEDGYVTITGRKKSLIVNREGKNIYPEEVEACINRSDIILESLVVGVKSPGESGERVGVIVVPDQEGMSEKFGRSGKDFDIEFIEKTMRAEVREQVSAIAPFKRPRTISVRMEEFEKTSTKKIKRYLYEIKPSDV